MLPQDGVTPAQRPTPVEGRQGGKSNSFYRSERVMRGENVINTLYTWMKVSKNKIIQTNILKNDTEWMIPKPRIFEYLLCCVLEIGLAMKA